MKNRIYIMLAALLALVSCERRILESPDKMTTIKVNISTDAVPNVTEGIYNEKIPLPEIDPEVMHIVFFEADGDRLVSESYISEKERDAEGNIRISGNLHILPGRYKMMIYNFGTESTAIRDYDSWTNAQAYTETVSDNVVRSYRRSAAEDDEIIVYEPDHLLFALDPALKIPYHEGEYTIEAVTKTIVESYYLQIRVEGLEYVSSAHAFLSGMASGNRLSEKSMVVQPENTVYFNLVKSDDGGVPVLCNVFNTFGHIGDSDNSLSVNFEIKTLDGRELQRSFDISGLFDTDEAKEHHWLLLEETITVDPPEEPLLEPGGGLEPTVGNWDNEDHDIVL